AQGSRSPTPGSATAPTVDTRPETSRIGCWPVLIDPRPSSPRATRRPSGSSPPLARSASTSPTTCPQLLESGRRGAEVLLAEIEARSEQPPVVPLAPELVVRATTAPPREGR